MTFCKSKAVLWEPHAIQVGRREQDQHGVVLAKR